MIPGYVDNIALWNYKDGKLETVLSGDSIALSRGRLAVGSGRNGNIQLWNVNSGVCDVLGGHTGDRDVEKLLQLSDGRLASCSDDDTVRLWDTNTGDSQKINLITLILSENVMKRRTAIITSLVELPEGRLASVDYEGSVIIWNTATGQCLHLLVSEPTDGNEMLLLNVNGQLAATQMGGVIVWDIDTGECVKALPSYYPTSLLTLSSGVLAVGCDDGIIRLWR